jgi:hypothetical protein
MAAPDVVQPWDMVDNSISCAGYMVYVFQKNERKGRTEGPFPEQMSEVASTAVDAGETI